MSHVTRKFFNNPVNIVGKDGIRKDAQAAVWSGEYDVTGAV